TLLQAAWPQALCLRGLEGLHGMPYRPLLEVLQTQVAALARALREPSHPLRPYRLDLARVLPELAPDELLPPLDALTARTRLVEALTRAVESLTPVLLVDDLQWCDMATVEWLVLLAHGGRLRWRAAARRHEIGADLAQALQALHSAVRLEELDLPPLDRPAIAQACNHRWPGQDFSPERLDRLWALSGGNAFLLGELVAAGAGAQGAAQGLSVQARVAELVLARSAGLGPLARQVVEAAAVFVQPVPAGALVSGSAADVVALDAGRACEQARAAGLLVADAAAARDGPGAASPRGRAAQEPRTFRRCAQPVAAGGRRIPRRGPGPACPAGTGRLRPV
ncbi:MAG: hypothetical protein CFE45_43180, partial [Burkholderiales bacterium PBB5]